MIKNIILDFGDIFINLDKEATAKSMKPFGFTHLTDQLDAIFKLYEKGMISSDEFLSKVALHFPKASRTDLLAAWNAILLDFPENRLKFVEDLASNNTYRLFLLSNTNEIHIDFVKQQMGMENYNRFKNSFEVFYLSYEMGMRKPDKEIFEFVLQQNQLNPSETIFVDDTKENTDSAAGLGIHTWNLIPRKEDITQLKNHL